MKLRGYVIALTLTSAALFSLHLAADAQAPAEPLFYKLANPKLWSLDLEIAAELEIDGPEHFQFSESEDIDLNFVPIDDDLLASFKERGEAQFVKDIMSGKNRINAMFAVADSFLVSKEISDLDGGGKLLTLRLRQVIDDEFFTVEKWFIYPKTALQVSFRHSVKADRELVTKAEAEFNKIQVRQR